MCFKLSGIGVWYSCIFRLIRGVDTTTAPGKILADGWALIALAGISLNLTHSL